MSAQFGVKFATAGGCRFTINLAIRASVIALAMLAAGCTPATTRLAGADSADPAAGVAGVGYNSTIAPYTSMRPSAPAPWRERNDKVAPQPGNAREPQ
jgi:hypothetical protein